MVDVKLVKRVMRNVGARLSEGIYGPKKKAAMTLLLGAVAALEADDKVQEAHAVYEVARTVSAHGAEAYFKDEHPFVVPEFDPAAERG